MAALKTLEVTAGEPSADLYSFRGTLKVEGMDSQDLDLKQFLHRGAIVVNSEYIDAMVVYTGRETKIVMN